jgi:hypothetical protein
MTQRFSGITSFNGLSPGNCAQGLIKVGNDVFDVFNPNGYTDHFGKDASFDLLLRG